LSDGAGEDISADYREVRRLARQLGARETVLDGVVRTEAKPTTYAIFDLLYLDGHDLTAEPYARRRELLAELELDGDDWQTPGHSVGHLKELLVASRERGLAGLVFKRLDSRYEPGRRSDAWRSVE
jgi:bifunctional non-homologous end joining protein LigD